MTSTTTAVVPTAPTVTPDELDPVLLLADTDPEAMRAMNTSKSGAARHPDWYHNLVADPCATIEVGGATAAVRARIARGAQRRRLFERHVAVLPNFAAYQQRTTRQLPVVVLEPGRI